MKYEASDQAFDGPRPKMNPKPILIYDTTLRDGSQGEGVSFSLQDKLNIAARLAEIGIDFIDMKSR